VQDSGNWCGLLYHLTGAVLLCYLERVTGAVLCWAGGSISEINQVSVDCADAPFVAGTKEINEQSKKKRVFLPG
jgi:hypothetical protein